jgi:hypothetical protein
MELLVTITIIGIMSGLVFGALHSAREMSAASATKATITKLNAIIMKRYESYLTRRVPISTTGMSPKAAALTRLNAIRDLMWMEMPDHFCDIDGKDSYKGSIQPPPALWQMYNGKVAASVAAGKPATLNFEQAKLLYLIVSMGSPEAMQQFSQSEIAVDPGDGWSYFVDGWGHAIFFLRWAPGFSNRLDLLRLRERPSSADQPQDFNIPAPSDIQSGDPINDHDPFDTRRVDSVIPGDPSGGSGAFRLIPLIYSAGPNSQLGIFLGDTAYSSTGYQGDPYATYLDSVSKKKLLIGTPLDASVYGEITNHQIEAR